MHQDKKQSSIFTGYVDCFVLTDVVDL